MLSGDPDKGWSVISKLFAIQNRSILAFGGPFAMDSWIIIRSPFDLNKRPSCSPFLLDFLLSQRCRRAIRIKIRLFLCAKYASFPPASSFQHRCVASQNPFAAAQRQSAVVKSRLLITISYSLCSALLTACVFIKQFKNAKDTRGRSVVNKV